MAAAIQMHGFGLTVRVPLGGLRTSYRAEDHHVAHKADESVGSRCHTRCLGAHMLELDRLELDS